MTEQAHHRPEDHDSRERFAARGRQTPIDLGRHATVSGLDGNILYRPPERASEQTLTEMQQFLRGHVTYFKDILDPQEKQAHTITVYHPKWDKEAVTKGWRIGPAHLEQAPGATYFTYEAEIATEMGKGHDLTQLDLSTLSKSDIHQLHTIIESYSKWLATLRYNRG